VGVLSPTEWTRYGSIGLRTAMADVVDGDVRSRIMGRIRSKNTRPELIVRKALFAEGFRFRVHVSGLPGCPDVVLPRHRAVFFVHGCFWHGHRCRVARPPKSNTRFWRLKIQRNRKNDRRSLQRLNRLGWRVIIVRECALRGPTRMSISAFRAVATQSIRGADRHGWIVRVP
jgi:DNA mismatch endonuclease, patch repair protein